MFGSSGTPFGTGAGFGTATGKFFSIYISNQGIQSAIGCPYLFFTTFRFPGRRLNQK